jgi:ABC-type nickel/cobalt efflux system permease component RcnA
MINQRRLPVSVAISLIVAGTLLFLGSAWVIPFCPLHSSKASGEALTPTIGIISAIIGMLIGAWMIYTGIDQSIRSPENQA